MIIISGFAQVRQQSLQDALALSAKHVERSAAEPGCISHTVSQDVQQPTMLVFFERWQDKQAVEAHFALDSSKQFVKNLSALCTREPVITRYQAEPI